MKTVMNVVNQEKIKRVSNEEAMELHLEVLLEV